MTAAVVADTHVLLWMLDGSLPQRSGVAASRIEQAVEASALHVSVGTFLDLRYLVDSGRRPVELLDEARVIVEQEPFRVEPLDLQMIDAVGSVPRAIVPDPFDRIIAATALKLSIPLVNSDGNIQAALGDVVVW